MLNNFLQEFRPRSAALEAMLMRDEVRKPVRLSFKKSRGARGFQSGNADADAREVYEFRRQLFEIGLKRYEKLFGLERAHVQVLLD